MKDKKFEYKKIKCEIKHIYLKELETSYYDCYIDINNVFNKAKFIFCFEINQEITFDEDGIIGFDTMRMDRGYQHIKNESLEKMLEKIIDEYFANDGLLCTDVLN